MNLQKLIEVIAEAADKRFDFPTEQMVKDLIFAQRSEFIRQQYEKTGLFPNSALVQICLDLEQKSSTECCGVDLGCKVTVTKDIIPVPIDVKSQLIFDYVGSINGMNPFGYVKPVEIPFISYRRLSSQLTYYTYINNKLVFINAEALEKAKLIYVPANPIDVLKLKNCEGSPCIDLTSEVFIEPHWVNAIITRIVPLIKTSVEQIKTDENER